MAKKQTSTKKIKKKKWFPVVAPQLLGGRVLGETILSDSSAMKGRLMTMNLMNITGDPKRQNTNIQLRIRDVKDGQGQTEIVKFERITSFMKRLVRRGRNKIDDSFIVKTGDGKRARVKTITITNSYAPKSVGTSLRQETRKLLKDFISKHKFEQSVDEFLKNSVQKDIRNKIKKIVPVRTFDIRVFKLETARGLHAEDKKEAEAKEEVKEAVEETKEEVKETRSSEAVSAPKSEVLSAVEKVEEKKAEVEEKVEKKVEAKAPVKKTAAKKAPAKAEPKAKKAPAKKAATKKAPVKKAPAKKAAKK